MRNKSFTGFTLLFEAWVEELNSTARFWRHDKSAAQLLSFCNKDENKVFGVTLRTPPQDSTGLPHILEHSVLCGSAKYPVKEPFVELLKGSLQTFLNAFTYPDKTCYPVASANLQDFYNLVEVYLDAVFHPKISEAIFQQEGWHLDAASCQQSGQQSGEQFGEPEIYFKGVVYNEMKGVFSSPEAVLERASMRSLFPDTPYGLESGGDPADIPSLTYADFVNFHKKFYHPSNARFYFWGDDPEEKRLQILDELLKNYTAADCSASGVSLQAPFRRQKRLKLPFAAGEDDQAMFTLNWAFADTGGTTAEAAELGLALPMLEHILLGMPASPLRRALIESGLGEDLAGGGLEDELRQKLFSIGLKGLKGQKGLKGSEKAVEKLVLQTLGELVEKGVPRPCVEAAVNSVEFALRENNTGRFPVGLAVMLRSLTSWLYCDEPAEAAVLAPLRFEAPLAAIKQKALSRPDSGSGYFEGLIKKYLLDNQHRAAILLYPDLELNEKQAGEEQGRLAKAIAGLDAGARTDIAANAEALRLMQETPDRPEDLAKIPHLQVKDLPLRALEIEQKLLKTLPFPVYFHPQPTRGICYLDVHLGISAVPDRLLPLIPLLGRAMLEMGNAGRDFVELNMNIARITGGIDSGLALFTTLPDRALQGSLCISGKAAPDKIAALFDIMAELMLETELDNQEHFCRMLFEEKARLEHGLVPSGHTVVIERLKAHGSLGGSIAEACGGVSYLKFIRNLAQEARDNWPVVLNSLLELRKILLNRNADALMLNITANAGQEEELREQAGLFADKLPVFAINPVSRDQSILTGVLPAKEALLVPAQVNFVGRGLNIFDLGYRYHGSALVILKYLRTGFLWEKIRVQGGAYGAFASLDRFSGDFVFASYRDPNISATLQAFEASMAHLATHKPSKSELDAAIVGAIGELDTYLLPEAKGKVAFGRAVTGNTPELRAKIREEVLSAKAAHFKHFGEFLTGVLPQACEVALGGQNLEEYAVKNQDAGWVRHKIL